MSVGYNVNCKFIIAEHECSNVQVKRESWGWSKQVICKDWLAGPFKGTCRFREEIPKPNITPPSQGKTN